VSWAIRYHQVLRFFPDESYGYKYPDSYIRLFGADYVPEPHIQEATGARVSHKWYDVVPPHHRERPLRVRSRT
jgi:hypothetical protein